MRIKSTSWTDSLNITIFSLGECLLFSRHLIAVAKILYLYLKYWRRSVNSSILLTVTSILIHVLPLDFSRGYINCLIDEVVYLVENQPSMVLTAMRTEINIVNISFFILQYLSFNGNIRKSAFTGNVLLRFKADKVK